MHLFARTAIAAALAIAPLVASADTLSIEFAGTKYTYAGTVDALTPPTLGLAASLRFHAAFGVPPLTDPIRASLRARGGPPGEQAWRVVVTDENGLPITLICTGTLPAYLAPLFSFVATGCEPA